MALNTKLRFLLHVSAYLERTKSQVEAKVEVEKS